MNIHNPKEYLVHRFNSSKEIQSKLIEKDGKLIFFVKNFVYKGKKLPENGYLFSKYEINFPSKEVLSGDNETLSEKGEQEFEKLKEAFKVENLRGTGLVGISLPENIKNVEFLDAGFYEYPSTWNNIL